MIGHSNILKNKGDVYFENKKNRYYGNAFSFCSCIVACSGVKASVWRICYGGVDAADCAYRLYVWNKMGSFFCFYLS